jgi:hypothetical protein
MDQETRMASKGYQKVTAPVGNRSGRAAARGGLTMHQGGLAITVFGHRTGKQSSAMVGDGDGMRVRDDGSGQD